MRTAVEELEAELGRLHGRVMDEDAVRVEHERSLSTFGRPSADPREEAARRRRHLEWFLLEAPSDHLGRVPVESLQEDALEDDAIALCYAALRGSRVGIFVVRGIDPRDGLLLEDLLGRGRYLVPEPELGLELVPEDVVVGRLFALDPEGGRAWALSSAAVTLRNPELRGALERDLDRLRGGARGPLRMGQHELEWMFFAPELPATGTGFPDPTAAAAAPTEVPPPADPSEVAAEVRALLLAAGLEPERAEACLHALVAQPPGRAGVVTGGADALGLVLDELAIATEAELGAARVRLARAWTELHATPQAAPAPEGAPAPSAGPRAAAAPREPERSEPESDDARAALARFDLGRAEGRDLGELFDALERDLGIADAASAGLGLGLPAEAFEEDDAEGPELLGDLPEVMSALVTEFLWEGARTAGVDDATFAERHAGLALLADFGASFGLAEEFGPEELVEFLAVALWRDRARWGSGVDVAALALSLAEFLPWLAEAQGLTAWDRLPAMVAGLLEDLPRLAALNARLADGAADAADRAGTFELVLVEDHAPVGRARLTAWGAEGPEDVEARLDEPLEATLLRPGDLLVGALEGGTLRCISVHPTAAGPWLKATS